MDNDTPGPSVDEILESCPIGISISRVRDGRIADANEAGQRIPGFQRDDVVGRTSHELGFWVEPVQGEALVREFLEKGRCSPRPLRMRRKDGSIISFLID